MNKRQITKGKKLGKETTNMRVLLKQRQNHKPTPSEISPNIPNRTYSSSSHGTPIPLQDFDLQQVRHHVRNRIKTELKQQILQINTNQHPWRTPKTPHHSSTPLPLAENSSHRSCKTSLELSCVESIPKIESSPIPSEHMSSKSQKNKLTLEKIQVGMSQQIPKRLKTCMKFNKSTDWKVDITMNSLLTALKQLQQSQETNEDSNVKPCSKMIELIEQLLAQNSVEAQILKKYYFNKNSQQYFKKIKFKPSNTVRVIPRNPEENSRKTLPFFIKISENRRSFQKPLYSKQSKAYQTQYFSSGKGRQPLPRSSYCRQFLDFKGGVPRLPISKPVDSTVMKNSNSSRQMKSAYRLSFTAKKSQTVNNRQLDACRNKIRQLSINFGKRQRDNVVEKLNKYIYQKRQEKNKQPTIKVPFLKNSLLSQSRRQYRGFSEDCCSRIKDQNLNKLKYEYKKKANI